MRESDSRTPGRVAGLLGGPCMRGAGGGPRETGRELTAGGRVAGDGTAGGGGAWVGAVRTTFAAGACEEGATAFRLPDRGIVIVAPNASAPILEAALARHASTVEADVWRWFGVSAGVPWISAATSDRFVPQTANWDLLGGVNFQKGWHTGQEIVERMQYLGRVKERLFACHTNDPDEAPEMRI